MLILEKMRGLSEKNGWNIFSLGIIFLKKTNGLSPRVHGPPLARSTVDCSWTGGSSSPKLGLRSLRCSRAPTKRQTMGRRVREPVKGLTGGRAAARWPGDGGEWATAINVPVRGSLELRERRRRE
jgi:hypothetical protein